MVKLIDAAGKTIDILGPDIEEMHESTISMMPDNLVLDDFAASSFPIWSPIWKHCTSRSSPVFAVPTSRSRSRESSSPIGFTPIQPAEMKFANPVWCSALAGVPGQLIVLEQQEAKVWRLEPTASGMARHLFLDLTGQVKYGANWGLLCVAFHPQFKTNRRYFLEYQVEEQGVVKTTVVERQASEDLLHDAGVPSRRLFDVVQTGIQP